MAKAQKGDALDMIQTSAWLSLMDWLSKKPDAWDAFSASTGIKVPRPPTTALERMIDQACGVDSHAEQVRFVAAFIRWATIEHWGEDEITPSIQEALDRLPQLEGNHA